MKNFSISAAILCAAVLFSACEKASVSGKVTPVPASGRILVETAQGASMKVVDSVKLASDGSFSFKIKLEKDQPEFYYVYKDEVKLASLVLKNGDRIKLQCDTVGCWTVEGSEDCELLRQREIETAKAFKGANFSLKDYIAFYRESLRFVLSHTKSMASVPTLFQKLGETPVFAQMTDGIIFKSVADSLATLYPDSKYVALLRNEGKSRIDQMNMKMKLEGAQTKSYPDLNYPDMTGTKVKLSDIVEDCALVVFWDATIPACKVFNQDVLFPLYEKYGNRGLKIYQVNIGTDKAGWALTVRSQNLPWINVCDTKGSSIAQYSVSAVPSMFLVNEEALYAVTVKDVEAKIKEILK